MEEKDHLKEATERVKATVIEHLPLLSSPHLFKGVALILLGGVCIYLTFHLIISLILLSIGIIMVVHGLILLGCSSFRSFLNSLASRLLCLCNKECKKL